MINLLPPTIKEQVTFSKRNAMLVKYFWVALFTALVLAGAFCATFLYLRQRLTAAKQEIAQKEAKIATYKGLKDNVKNLNLRVASIKSIQARQAKFSALLGDLSKSMPAGTALTAISLTGDDKKPVTISAVADSYNGAVGLRDTLAASSRIAAADIQTVSGGKDGYHVDILVSFKPGQSK